MRPNALPWIRNALRLGTTLAVLAIASSAGAAERTIGGVLISGPDSHDFGEVAVGDQATTTIQFTNNSGRSRDFVIKYRDKLGFFDFTGQKRRTLAAGRTRSVTLRFSPALNGDFENEFLIKISDPDKRGKDKKLGVDAVPVEGTGIGANLGIDLVDVDYGDVLIGSESLQRITITNLTNEDAEVFDLTAGKSPFRVTQILDESMTNAVTLPKTLAPGEEMNVIVRFKPKDEGSFRGRLEIASLWFRDGEVSIPLRGNGVSELGLSEPRRVDFGMVAANVFHQRSFYLRNNGLRMLSGKIVTKKFPGKYFSFTGAGNFTLAPGEMRDVTIQFGSRGNCVHDHPIKIVSDGVPGGKKSIRVSVESYK